jgi:ribosomal protein L7/L12
MKVTITIEHAGLRYQFSQTDAVLGVALLDQVHELARATVASSVQNETILVEVGYNRIPIIKIIRDCTGYTLVQAKALTENLPQPLPPGPWTTEMVSRIRGAGGVVRTREPA